jgi:hypothetical protein
MPVPARLSVMDTSAAADQPARLSDDTALTAHLETLLQGALRRQFWMIFLDEEGEELGPVMPCDDLPPDPRGLARGRGPGARPPAEVLAHWIAGLMDEFEVAQVVFVWERRGGRRIGEDERVWARELGRACVHEAVRVRAQFLLHDRGLRVLAPDDYL